MWNRACIVVVVVIYILKFFVGVCLFIVVVVVVVCFFLALKVSRSAISSPLRSFYLKIIIFSGT